MTTSIRDGLKALIISSLTIAAASSAMATPFEVADGLDLDAAVVKSEELRKAFGDDSHMIFDLSFHAAPHGHAVKSPNGAKGGQELKFAAAFPTTQPSNFSSELYCLALNIYHEARGESEEGKRAVGHVVMNRVTDHRFPRSVCRVVRQGGERHRNRCQFSWWCDGRSDRPRNTKAWRSSVEIALEIIAGLSDDPTGGALWYHADYVRPYWRKAYKRGPKIGQHIFYQARTARSL